MIYLEVLVEGASDEPVVKEILSRKFRLVENKNFCVRPHQGKGKLPANPNKRPNPARRGLLDQLPAKLRSYAGFPDGYHVVVLVDADREDCRDLLKALNGMYERLEKKPRSVLFRIAVEETESWFIADKSAIKGAYPKAKVRKLPRHPDQVVGAWEKLAEAIGENPNYTGARVDKQRWAEDIAPHLNLEQPRSPSLKAFIRGIDRIVSQ